MAGQASELIAKFRETFPDSGAPRVYRAPGRINLIGDHTDYNDGFVLPIAIGLACWIATSDNTQGLLRIYSGDMQKYFEIPLEALREARPKGDWSDYVAGVAVELQAAGVALHGQDIFIQSEVPIGAGLSSSAALEVVTALALMGGFQGDFKIDRVELAKLCQRAENRFAGMPCGIMDQFISIHGIEGGALRLDCRSLEFEPVRLPESIAIVAVNSMLKRELAASQYAVRRMQCQQAVNALSREHPHVKSLRDVTSEMLTQLPEGPERMRARHVVSENQRVEGFVRVAREDNPVAMGEYLVQSHHSLRDDFEVSCEELDFLVSSALAITGVYGARMTGGGFGGCTVNLLDRALVPEFTSSIRAMYRERYGVDPQVYVCEAAAGALPAH